MNKNKNIILKYKAMCYSAPTSLGAFIIGIIGSYLLYNYGNKKYEKENQVYSLFLLYVIFMQLFDFIFWIDPKNKWNLNQIFTYIAPFFNLSQPLLLYILKIIYNKPKINGICDYLVLLVNIIYAIVFLMGYSQFINNTKPLLTLEKDGHLEWKWLNYFNALYFVAFIINIFYTSKMNYSIMSTLVIFLSLFLSSKINTKFVGEIWCFIASIGSLFLLGFSYIL
jgi:hypothetical protein